LCLSFCFSICYKIILLLIFSLIISIVLFFNKLDVLSFQNQKTGGGVRLWHHRRHIQERRRHHRHTCVHYITGEKERRHIIGTAAAFACGIIQTNGHGGGIIQTTQTGTAAAFACGIIGGTSAKRRQII